MKKIIAISGSTRANSSNLKLLRKIATLTKDIFAITIFEGIDTLPHFNPDLDNENAPEAILEFRTLISTADGIIICTPEYVFSLPGSLKNALEWCVSSSTFSLKPTGLITASASGEKGHEQLLLVMKTIEANFNEETTLLIKGVKGKIKEDGTIQDAETISKIKGFIKSFDELLKT